MAITPVKLTLVDSICSRPIVEMAFIPIDVVKLIFSDLSAQEVCKAGRVCRQFYLISIQNYLWNSLYFRTFSVRPGKEPKKEYVEQYILWVNHQFKSVLSNLKSITDDDVELAVTKAREVRKVSLDKEYDDSPNISITGLSLRLIGKSCPFLEELSLTSGLPYIHCVTDQDIADLMHARRKTIRAVILRGIPKLSENGCMHVITIGENLRYVGLDTPVLSNQVVKTLVTRHPNLTGLELLAERGMNNETLTYLVKHPLPLQNLEIYSNTMCFSADKVLSFINQYKNLCSFAMKGCKTITDGMVHSLCLGSPFLSYIFLGGCRDITISSILDLATLCPKLETIYLRDCKNPDKLGNFYSALKAKGYFSHVTTCSIHKPE